MRARIGVAESTKVIEIDVEDPVEFKADIEASVGSEALMLWFTDTKGRTVGVPLAQLAYVEIDSDESARTVGFAP